MDWTGCDLVECIPGKVSGVPLVRGTRVPSDIIVSNFETGSPVDEIAENYPSVSPKVIRSLLAFARARRLPRAS